MTDMCPRHSSRFVAVCLNPGCRNPPECCVQCIRDHYPNCNNLLIIDLQSAPRKILYTNNPEAQNFFKPKFVSLSQKLEKSLADAFSNQAQPQLNFVNARAIREAYHSSLDPNGTVMMTKRMPIKLLIAREMLDRCEKEIDALMNPNFTPTPAMLALLQNQMPRDSGVGQRQPLQSQGSLPPGAPGVAPRMSPNPLNRAPMGPGPQYGAPGPQNMGFVPAPDLININLNPKQRVFDASMITVLDADHMLHNYETRNNKILVSNSPGETTYIVFLKHLKMIRAKFSVPQQSHCSDPSPSHACFQMEANYVKEYLFNNKLYSSTIPEYNIHSLTQSANNANNSMAPFANGFYVTADEPKELFFGSFSPYIDPNYKRINFGTDNCHLVFVVRSSHAFDYCVEILDFDD